MDEATKRALQTAYQLIKGGRKKPAFSLLVALIKANPNLPDAWYLMGFAVDDPQKRLYAFRQVLRINPTHEAAQKQVARLLSAPPAPSATPQSRPMVRSSLSSASALARPEHKQPARSKPGLRVWLWVCFALLAVCIAAIPVFGLVNGALPALFMPTAAPTFRSPTLRLPTAVPSSTPVSAPDFRTIACPFDVPLGTRVQCGVVQLPQDRSKSLTRLIEIPVVIYHSSKPDAGALVYLQGGPGIESINWSLALFDGYVTPLLEEYDMIFFDPRGTGRSKPRLDCPELNDIYIEMFLQARSEEESFEMFTETWAKCNQRFQKDGVDPAAFNTTESAADVRDIVKALGYDQVNLIGISYGTRLALTIMRDYPEIVRSAVIDSVVPMQRSMFSGRADDVQYALNKMFADCASSSTCNSAYPELQNKFNALIQRFDQEPVMVKIIDPRVGFVHTIPVNGVDMVGAVVAGMHDSTLLPVIPKAIYDIEKGDYTFLSYALGASGSSYDALSMGTYFATACHEQVYFTTPEEMDAALSASSVIRKYVLASMFGNPRRLFQLCDSWGALPYNPLNRQPVTSDIPTLVLAGEYDPTTPVTTAEMVSKDLPNDYFYIIPGMGHGATVGNECAMTMVKSFLRNPAEKPDSRCLESLASFEFFLPYDGHPVTFVPFIEPPLRLKGMIPQGWRKETIDSIYYRRAYLFDPTLALFDIFPLPQKQTFQVLSSGFINIGFDEPAKEIDARQANGLDWTIYAARFNGEPVFIAFAEVSHVRTIVLAMVVSAPEQDASYNGLFLPMVDALISQ